MRIREQHSDFKAERPATGPDPEQNDPRTESPLGPEHPLEKPRRLRFHRLWSRPGVHPFEEVEWELRSASITNERGDVAFEQPDVEIPRAWSQLATNIVVSKYFRGPLGTPQRERSVRQLIARVSDTIAGWGRQCGYFATEEDAEAFHGELTHLLVQQKASFNSPVWFNTGVDPKPQASACFINSVEDRMESILDLAKTEGMLFKYGSGTGSNLSTLRSSREFLGGGGTASGPVSFMKGYDAFAGVIKSGGRSRRAAKMVILNAGHPDILAFVRSKAEEEKKAWALIEAGYDPGFNIPGGAYDSVFFQNANHSVRVTDDFMKAVIENRDWTTRAVTTGEVMDTYRARDLLREMAEAAWVCGDPGLQFDTTTNEWHTVPNSGRINASNPCVTGDTLVATEAGWRRIDALAGSSARIIGADGQPHVVTEIFPTGTKPVFRLRTKAGYEVRITGDHKVWTLERGDVAAKDLLPGDRLQLQGPGFGRRVLPERLAVAVGIAVGDGCLAGSHASGRVREMVVLTMAAEEAGVLQTIAGAVNEEKALRRAAGAVGRPDGVEVRNGGSGGSRLAFASQPVVEIFKRFAVLAEGSAGKRFTDEIWGLDRPSLAAVLRGLFTADGTVANYAAKSQYVSLDSTSVELLRQVQMLLLGFSIKSKLYRERRGGKLRSVLPDGRGGRREYPVQEIHSLRISRSSRFLFEREIGFDASSPKAEALRLLNDAVGVYHDDLTDTVLSVEPAGEEPVFDLTEQATHHFVANGLLVHNCSEFVFLDDTSCNLSSLNLMRFRGPDGELDVEAFRHAVDVMITAQEIIVDNASYPTAPITAKSHEFRPLGLGFANLGALLMARGLPYDSDEGRAYAGAVTALMCGEAYAQSARVASGLGPFAAFERNGNEMLRVMGKHREASLRIPEKGVPSDLLAAARGAWDEALSLGEGYGYRNAQVTVLAPTGTIAFMMDCDTTGIEPDIALVKYKKLVGGGMLKIVNQTVPEALRRLGYGERQVKAVISHIDREGTIEGAPGLKAQHLPVFDCAFKPEKGQRSIHYTGHIRMMAAVQPFLSGAISKTVNVPADTTVDEIEKIFIEGWQMGLKAIAIYRDGCKRTQPLSTSKGEKTAPKAALDETGPARPYRRRLPDERSSLTHKFSIAGHEGYITVGLYEEGTPGEIFVTMAKKGSVVSGLMDSFATAVSLALQYGVPLKVLVDKFSHTRFEPSGFTNNPEIPIAKSLTDYIFRWLALRYLPAEERPKNGHDHEENGLHTGGNGSHEHPRIASREMEEREHQVFSAQADAPPCHECGEIMVRNGACYACRNCGSTSGCS